MFNLFELFLLLLVVAVLQFRHFNLHKSMGGAQGTSRHKVKMALATVIFSLTILHRALFALIKIILIGQGKDSENCDSSGDKCNVIMWLEK